MLWREAKCIIMLESFRVQTIFFEQTSFSFEDLNFFKPFDAEF